MYSTNTNRQQDGRPQAPDNNPAPEGGKYIIVLDDAPAEIHAGEYGCQCNQSPTTQQ